MNLWSISLRNLNIRKVSSTLTTLSIAVAAGLYAAIMLMAEQTRQRFEGSISGYQAVVGPKDASQLEVVLNAILNVGDAPGLIPLGVCKDLREGRVGRRSAVRHAIPQARGDSISKFSFPVIGTIDEMFTKFERGGQLLQFDQGGPWSFTWDELWVVAEQLAAHETAKRTKAQPVPPKPSFQPPWKQAVVGSRVARTLGLTIGSEIVPVHGKYGEFDFHEHPEATCRIVGILAPTNSPIDTTVFLPLATHLLVDGHEGGLFKVEVPAGKNPDAVKEMPVRADQIGLTAVVVDPVDHMGAQFLRLEFGTRPDAQVCWPGNVIPRFLQQVGNAADALTVIAWLVLVVAAIAIAVAIYNTMNERRREIAIMRSLGARRVQISAIIVGEAAMLSFVGSVVGVIACHVACLLLQGLVEDMTGVYLQWAAFSLRELWLVLGVTLLGALAGLLPAVKGSFTQVADNLAPNY